MQEDMLDLQVKALVQVDYLMYALSKHKHNPYLTGIRKKWLLKFTQLSFYQNWKKCQ